MRTSVLGAIACAALLTAAFVEPDVVYASAGPTAPPTRASRYVAPGSSRASYVIAAGATARRSLQQPRSGGAFGTRVGALPEAGVMALFGAGMLVVGGSLRRRKDAGDR